MDVILKPRNEQKWTKGIEKKKQQKIENKAEVDDAKRRRAVELDTFHSLIKFIVAAI